MATGQLVDEEDISKLLSHYVKNSHRVKSADIKGETIMEKCTLLFHRDYKFTIVPNFNGELCAHYPMKLIVTEFERDCNSSTEHVESKYNQQHLTQKIKNARCARCRSRFVCPVIFYQGRHICRSATLSGGAEMFGRSTTDYLLSNQGGQDIGSDMFDKFRGQDIQLLKYFDVGFICDLMVEKKKTKLWMPITSSEKVDKENRYSDFSILCMPYPGCEFFKDWKDNAYVGETTMYDWGQALNDSKLDLPSSPMVDQLSIDWSKYTDWNLVELTQNYLKLLIEYIKHGDSGLLIHCISGWDRTPLFVSLLRLSLWADGAVHQSLSATEILYLTLGYDWYLFGHDLPDRINNGEEVMYFCFRMLKDIAADEFSVVSRPPANSEESVQPLAPPSVPSRGPAARQTCASPVTQPQHRVDSDLSLGISGVLLGEEQMAFPQHGSISSLNSLSDSENPESINFSMGVHEEEVDADGDCPVVRETSKPISASKSQQRSSVSPPSQRPTTMARHISPASSSAGSQPGGRQSLDNHSFAINSNHFTNSPKVGQSSPMTVPQMGHTPHEDIGYIDPLSFSPSVGSWQIISSSDNLRGMAIESSNSHSSIDRVSSCLEAEEINQLSVRWQRLDAISRQFERLYGSCCPPSAPQHSSGLGLTSFLGRVAEHVGLKGARQQQQHHAAGTSAGLSRAGV